MNNNILSDLDKILSNRKLESTKVSYVAALHAKGLNKILEKVGEECTEVIIAAKDAELTRDSSNLIAETADLWFHTLIMLSEFGEKSESILTELERRFHLSGLEEKASRKSD
tara:strand:+ start:431 stop:766 length:336 start_codon:yes stop_codon:yes gene_type:complete